MKYVSREERNGLKRYLNEAREFRIVDLLSKETISKLNRLREGKKRGEVSK